MPTGNVRLAFAFEPTGKAVTFDVSGEHEADPKAEMKKIMARQ